VIKSGRAGVGVQCRVCRLQGVLLYHFVVCGYRIMKKKGNFLEDLSSDDDF